MKTILRFTLITLILNATICGTLYAQNVIQLVEDGGIYKVPCTVNGLRLKLIFDTGASNVCISETVAMMMLDNDYLSEDDIKGTSKSQVADGRVVDNTVINLKSIKIGDKELKNIDAIVISGQSAQLLLGQSALKKLGEYTISGNKLIFGSNSQPTNDAKYTQEQIDMLFEKAREAYKESLYYEALNYYRTLYENDQLSAYGIFIYANCYLYTNSYSKALTLYVEIIDKIEEDFPDIKADLYYNIGECLEETGNYSEAISYYEEAKYNYEPFSEDQYYCVWRITTIYHDTDKLLQGERILNDYISQYLSFKHYKKYDCWDKRLKDDILAKLYMQMSFMQTSISRSNVYFVLAAAWGSKLAMDFCDKFNLNYRSRP